MSKKIHSNTKSSEVARLKPKMMGVKDAAKYIGVSRATIYNHLDINGGAIGSTLIRRRGYERGRRLVYRDSLEAFVQLDRPASERLPECGANPE